MKRKYLVALGALITTAVAAAVVTWGPFLVITINPTMTFNDDRDMNFASASTIAQVTMQASVQNIKKGDYVRVVYPDGKIYDFKTTRRCAAAASQASSFEENPVEMTTKDQSHVDIDRIMDDYYERTGRDLCDSADNTLERIATGYYGSESVVDGNTITTTGRFISTGFVYMNRGTMGCR